MAYDTNQLFLVDQAGGGAAQNWILLTADAPATFLASGYISDAQARGVKAGDGIEIRQYTTTAYTTLVSKTHLDVTSVSTSAVLGGEFSGPVAVTATSDGLTTGIIPASANVVQITSGNANHIVVLPAPVIGKKIKLINVSGTGFELRSSSPTTISINGGSGADAESALASTALLIHCECISATQWIANSHVAAGTESAVEAAA